MSVYNNKSHSIGPFFFHGADFFSFTNRQTDRITTSYGLDGQNRMPIGKRCFSLTQNVQTCPKTHPASYLMKTGVISWEKAAGT